MISKSIRLAEFRNRVNMARANMSDERSILTYIVIMKSVSNQIIHVQGTLLHYCNMISQNKEARTLLAYRRSKNM